MRLDSIITIIIKTALELQPASADQEKQMVRPKRGQLVFKKQNQGQAGECSKTDSSEIPT